MSSPQRIAVLVTAIVALAAPAAHSSGPQRDVERTNVANFEPAWSPNGREIAFASAVGGQSHIEVLDVQSRRTYRLTHDANAEFRPKFVPGGNRIAYLTGGDEYSDVTLVDAHGDDPQRPLPRVGSVDWSRDGKRVVYDVSDYPAVEMQIWVMNADGSHRRKIVANGSNDGANPVWSPDGRRIAFVGGGNTDFETIDVVRPDGRGRVKLTHGGREGFPSWSPDGRHLAFDERVRGGRHHIAVVNADGSGERVLTRGGWEDVQPVWSPDGRWIAFGSTRSGNSEIWAMHPDGTHLRRLTYGGCTVIGTRGNEVLVGTAGRDVICGLGGNDTIAGRGGDDRLLGGAGDDRIDGGSGNDQIFGQAGNDVLAGGRGSDRMDGGGGDDTMVARDGVHDRVEGGSGHDRALGDRADFAYDVEYGNLVDHRHPPQLSRAQIEARTVAAVRRSRARLVSLVVVVPGIRYALVIGVPDPARYLQHRARVLVDVMNKVTFNRRVRFKSIRFAVEDSSRKTVLSWTQTLAYRSASIIGFNVDPRYEGCISGLALERGDTADESPPACPVR